MSRANSVTSNKKLKELEEKGFIRYSMAKMKNILKPMFISNQGGTCAICPTALKLLPPARVVMDHDHRTKLIRAALCDNCNRQIGLPDKAGRGPEWYRSVADFLEKHQKDVDSGNVQMYIYPEPKPKAERRTTKTSAKRVVKKVVKKTATRKPR